MKYDVRNVMIERCTGYYGLVEGELQPRLTGGTGRLPIGNKVLKDERSLPDWEREGEKEGEVG